MLKLVIDEIAVQLATITGMNVYKSPVLRRPAKYPCCIISDEPAVKMTEYRPTVPTVVYHIYIHTLVTQRKDQLAYEELEKYISGDSVSSIKEVMQLVTIAGLSDVLVSTTGPRRKYPDLGRNVWGFTNEVLVLQT